MKLLSAAFSAVFWPTGGVSVREATTAEEAIAAVQQAPPDLLLLDINLPDHSGWDVLRALRQQGIAVPTIVISAVHLPARRLEEFRPLACLPKPFPLEALLRLVFGPATPTSPLEDIQDG
ncbi:MAG: hypothetical protein KatS3mg061_3207 [Dehalococcoidia bacterium]|nr:MAG: hypothetical protein KatS3mg061_3207 [Dehalococcoidia bacterium]